jgi:hypothetical protein
LEDLQVESASYKTFNRLMLLEGVPDGNLDEEWPNSFNPHALKRSKWQPKLEEFGDQTKKQSMGTRRG